MLSIVKTEIERLKTRIGELEAENERLREEIVEKDDYIVCLEDDIQEALGGK